MRVKKDPIKVQEKRNKILPCRSKEGKFMKVFKIAEFYVLYYDTQHIKQRILKICY